jgi:hypothetical protein
VVTFHPITLESVTATLLLRVDQNGFIPVECVVTARALSGKVESRVLEAAEANVLDYVVEAGSRLNASLGPKSTFKGTLNRASNQISKTDTVSLTKDFPAIDYSQTKVGQPVNLLQRSPAKNHFSDPTATVLASTFHSSDLNAVLDNVIQGTQLLKQKERKGGKRENEPVAVVGPGSGAVFDAGSQWIDIQHQKQFKKSRKKRQSDPNNATKSAVGSVLPSVSEDKVIDGYRIPPVLDSTTAVNFVLTQERGKLKPKDLKVAIEKNRAERDMRALEQKKMRDGTIGGTVGALDLRVTVIHCTSAVCHYLLVYRLF